MKVRHKSTNKYGNVDLSAEYESDPPCYLVKWDDGTESYEHEETLLPLVEENPVGR